MGLAVTDVTNETLYITDMIDLTVDLNGVIQADLVPKHISKAPLTSILRSKVRIGCYEVPETGENTQWVSEDMLSVPSAWRHRGSEGRPDHPLSSSR